MLQIDHIAPSRNSDDQAAGARGMSGLAPAIPTGTEIIPFEMRVTVDRIRSLWYRAKTDAKAIAIEIGRELNAVRDHLAGQGRFLRWIESQTGIEPRTAQRFMQFATWAEGRHDIVSHIDLTQGYLLSAPSVPGDAEADIIGRLRRGEVIDTRSMKELVDSAKYTEAKALARKQKAAARRARANTHQHEEEQRAKEKAAAEAAADELVQLLVDRLGDDIKLFKVFAEKVPDLSLCLLARRVAQRAAT